MVVGVLLDVGWLIPGHGSADVNQDSWGGVAVKVAITYLTDDHMRARQVFRFFQGQRSGVKHDADAQINPRQPDQVAEIVAGGVGILGRVDGHDIATAAAEQFIDAEVLEVAAIGDVDVITVAGRPAKEFVDQ